MMQPYPGQAGGRPTVPDYMLMNNRQGLHHRSMYGALNARGLSEGKETRPGTSAQWSARNQSVSSVVLFSVQPVSAGSKSKGGLAVHR